MAALALVMASFVGAWVWQARENWTFFESWTGLQQRYFNTYVRTLLLPHGGVTFSMLKRVNAKGRRPALNGDFGDDTARFEWGAPLTYENKDLYRWLKEAIYDGRSPWQMLGFAGWLGGVAFGLALGGAMRQDVRGWRIRRDGRRLRGPELVTVADFNANNRSNGIAFLVEEKRLFGRKKLGAVSVPRSVEAMHTLIMGDSGTGKSTLIKQLLMQIEQRGETAIVYDPALEYTPCFYRPERGDVILNPLDARMPYWSPADEVRHEAEAATIAESLFPDTHRDNPFFVEGPRKVFAHLLTFKSSPQELVTWLSHEEEIDRRVKGTPLASMVYAGAQQQRGGMLASLSMIADSMKLLPRREDANGTWAAAEWAKERKGWIFLTTTPEYRKPLRPLVSLWLDLLVLRLMNQGLVGGGGKRAWFVLDELASLQRLPQLHTAITENRKSGNPVVLGFQGRSQLETRYGHDAEAMISQPAVKVFLRTSEPHSADWISKTIGDVEMERLRESETQDQFPNRRASQGFQTQRGPEPLVMASQIEGLLPLHGYLKCGNLVVQLSISYLDLPKVREGFIPRQTVPAPPGPAALARPGPAAPALEPPVAQEEPAYFE
jgi:hypothetical protein